MRWSTALVTQGWNKRVSSAHNKTDRLAMMLSALPGVSLAQRRFEVYCQASTFSHATINLIWAASIKDYKKEFEQRGPQI